MPSFNSKEKIIEQYDLVSPYYYSLWGKHLHHGYWTTGKETKAEAQVALIEYLAQAANIRPHSKILDAGCGFGGSSIYLANHYHAEMTGINISSVQVAMAQEAAKRAQAKARFVLMDAEAITLDELYDVIWSIESISHYQDKGSFFKKVSQLLKQSGTIAIIDWFKKENLSAAEYEKYILPIEKGMLVELEPINDYVSMLESNGLQIIKMGDISQNAAKTWNIALDIIKNKMFWRLAIKNGVGFVDFLRSFRAMKAGFGSGNFVYGLIVAKKS